MLLKQHPITKKIMFVTLFCLVCLLQTVGLFAQSISKKASKNLSNASIVKSKKTSTIQLDCNVPNAWIKQFAIIERWIAGMRPTVSARALAYIHIGAFEAVLPSMPNYISNQKYITGLSIPQLPKPVSQYNWNLVLNAYYAKSDSNFLLGALPEWKATINV
jgi:hypothetical protein